MSYSSRKSRVSRLEQASGKVDFSDWTDDELERCIAFAGRDDLSPDQQAELDRLNARFPRNLPPRDMSDEEMKAIAEAEEELWAKWSSFPEEEKSPAG